MAKKKDQEQKDESEDEIMRELKKISEGGDADANADAADESGLEEEFESSPWTGGEDFSGFEQNFSRTGAPVLMSENSGGEESVEPLESQMNKVPSAKVAEGENVTYVKNAPEYEGSDYSRAVYEVMEQQGRNVRTDNQMDITAMRFMHRSPSIKQQQDINLGVWQRENIGGDRLSNRERDYQIAGRQERKSKDKLPFQQ